MLRRRASNSITVIPSVRFISQHFPLSLQNRPRTMSAVCNKNLLKSICLNVVSAGATSIGRRKMGTVDHVGPHSSYDVRNRNNYRFNTYKILFSIGLVNRASIRCAVQIRNSDTCWNLTIHLVLIFKFLTIRFFLITDHLMIVDNECVNILIPYNCFINIWSHFNL